MTVDPAAADRRRDTRGRRVGSNAACCLCGERDPRVLILEEHHVAGRANSPTTAVVCANCHLRRHESLRSLGVELRGLPPDTAAERLVAVLLSAGEFLVALGEELQGCSTKLSKLLGRLDEELPGWREWPEALP